MISEILQDLKSIEQLLDYENLLDDLKPNQYELSKFLILNPQHLHKIVDYVIIYDEKQTDQKFGIKYPFICSEMLGVELEVLADYILGVPVNIETDYDSQQGKQIFYHYMSFLTKYDPLPITSLGYFSKCITMLLRWKPNLVWQYFIDNPQSLKVIRKNLDNSIMIEIIYAIFIFQIYGDHTPLLQERKDFFRTLIDPSNTDACEIVRMTLEQFNDQQIQQDWDQKSEFVSVLYEYLDVYLSGMLKDQIKCASYVFLQYIIRENKISSMKVTENQQNRFKITDQGMQKSLINRFSEVMHVLKYGKGNDFKASFGSNYVGLGEVRLNILKGIELCTQNACSELYKTLIDGGLYPQLLKLMEDHEWNNQMLSIIEKIFKNTFEQCSEYYNILIFSEYQIHKQIIFMLRTEKEKPGQLKQSIVRGYRGHLNRIQNYIVNLCNQYDTIRNYVESFEVWNWYKADVLKQNNKLNNEYILGITPDMIQRFAYNEETGTYDFTSPK